MSALHSGELEAIFDEGLLVWLESSVKAGLLPLDLEPDHFAFLGELGWRRSLLKKGYWGSPDDHWCIDYSGWPLYAREDLPEHIAYEAAKAAVIREKEIVWEAEYKGISELFTESESSPIDVPLHPGAARFWKEYSGSP